MTAPITHTPGRFVWRELYSADPAKVFPFYSEVFGWNWDVAMEMGDAGKYYVARLGDRQLCGAMNAPGGDGRSWWTSVVSVSNVDQVVAKTIEQGGDVLMPATDMDGVGRYATVRDTDGAVFSVLKSANTDPPVTMPKTSEFAWETLMSTDTERSKKFYRAVLGWETQPGPGGQGDVFCVDRSESGMVADLGPAQGMPPAWVTYVNVENLEASRDRAQRLGGKVHLPLLEVPQIGRIAFIADPAGAAFGLFQPNHR